MFSASGTSNEWSHLMKVLYERVVELDKLKTTSLPASKTLVLLSWVENYAKYTFWS